MSMSHNGEGMDDHLIERLDLQAGAATALLIRPPGSEAHPAAVLQHGYGSRKEELLPLGLALAAEGFVSLLADTNVPLRQNPYPHHVPAPLVRGTTRALGLLLA